MLMNLTENCAYLQSKWHSHKNLWVYCFINWWNMYTFLSHSKSMIIKYLHYYYYDRRWMMKMMDKVNEMCSSFVRLTYTTSTTYQYLFVICLYKHHPDVIIIKMGLFFIIGEHTKRGKNRGWSDIWCDASPLKEYYLIFFCVCLSVCVPSTHQTMTCY